MTMPVDCERCDDLLLDLAYGELDEVTTDAVRRHVDGCTRCGAALADMELVREACRAIESPEPPISLDSRILEAARARVVPSAIGSPEIEQRRHIAVERRESFLQRVVRGFGALALKPQAAMAAVLVVVVGVALLIGDQARLADEERPSDALRAPTPVEPGTPPVSLVPISPAPPPGSRQSASQASPAQEVMRAIDESEGVGTGRGEEYAHKAPPATPAPVEVPMQEVAPRNREATREPASPWDRDDERAARPQAQAPERRAEGSQVGMGGGSSRGAAPAPGADAEMEMGAEESFESQQKRVGGGRVAFDRGIANYNRRNYGDAVDDLSEFVSRPGGATGLLGQAYLTMARSQKSLGQCGSAVGTYEEYLRRYGGSGSAAEARLEAADCYRAIGRTERARELYTQAESTPATRTRARSRRMALDAAEATDPVAEPPAAAAEAGH